MAVPGAFSEEPSQKTQALLEHPGKSQLTTNQDPNPGNCVVSPVLQILCVFPFSNLPIPIDRWDTNIAFLGQVGSLNCLFTFRLQRHKLP